MIGGATAGCGAPPGAGPRGFSAGGTVAGTQTQAVSEAQAAPPTPGAVDRSPHPWHPSSRQQFEGAGDVPLGTQTQAPAGDPTDNHTAAESARAVQAGRFDLGSSVNMVIRTAPGLPGQAQTRRPPFRVITGVDGPQFTAWPQPQSLFAPGRCLPKLPPLAPKAPV
jgi:hypothetical protein